MRGAAAPCLFGEAASQGLKAVEPHRTRPATSGIVNSAPITTPKIARPMPCFSGWRRMSRMARIPNRSANGAGKKIKLKSPRYPAAIASPDRPTGSSIRTSGSWPRSRAATGVPQPGQAPSDSWIERPHARQKIIGPGRRVGSGGGTLGSRRPASSAESAPILAPSRRGDRPPTPFVRIGDPRAGVKDRGPRRQQARQRPSATVCRCCFVGIPSAAPQSPPP